MSLTLKNLLFLSFLTFLTESHGKRNFDIIMDSLNCTTNPKYISEAHCYVDKTLKPPRAFSEVQVCRELKNIKYSLEVLVIRGQNDPLSLLSVLDEDACKFLAGDVDVPIVKIYRDALADAGELPRCPIGKDYRFVFKGIKVDAERFPPYVPESDFSLNLIIKHDKELIVEIRLGGSVVQKHKLRLG